MATATVPVHNPFKCTSHLGFRGLVKDALKHNHLISSQVNPGRVSGDIETQLQQLVNADADPNII